MAKRKKPSLKDRKRPCWSCKYPMSQQHHLSPVALFGDNPYTMPLCANCHELYHTIHNAYHLKSGYAVNLIVHLMLAENDAIFNSIVSLAGIVLALDEKLSLLEYIQTDAMKRVMTMFQHMPFLWKAYYDATHKPKLPGME